MNQINWAQVAVFAAVVLVVFILGITVLPFLFGGWGMMGPGMMGGGWYRGYGVPLGGIFGWLFMLLAMALPLGLLILGLVWLVRGMGGQGAISRPAPTRPCPNCGQRVQPDWQLCPYCGQNLLPGGHKHET